MPPLGIDRDQPVIFVRVRVYLHSEVSEEGTDSPPHIIRHENIPTDTRGSDLGDVGGDSNLKTSHASASEQLGHEPVFPPTGECLSEDGGCENKPARVHRRLAAQRSSQEGQ